MTGETRTPRPRIAIVTSFPADPLRPSGGVESVSVTLVEYLARAADFEWHVVTLDHNTAAATRSEWRGVTLHRLPDPGGAVLTKSTGRGRRLIHATLASLRPDLIHAHDTYGLMVKGFRAAPRVFTVHGFIHKDTLVSGQRLAWLRSQIWKPVEIGGWADQDHIVSISPYVREFLAGHTRATIHDIDNPIREDFFRIERRVVPGRIFCAAEISPRKNTLVLVKALQRLLAAGIDAELRLAGKVANAGYGAELDRYVTQKSLGDRVKRLGLIAYEQVKEELATASIFALPSLEENSPMGIEEAMAAGVPVVTSNRCGMPYMVRDGESGFLIDPNDPADVAARMAEILVDSALSGRMAAAAKAIAADRFHPLRVAERTLGVYRRALARGRGGRG